MAIVDRGPYRGARFPKRQVNPSDGEQRLRCGGCGGMDFEVHVRPVLILAQVSALVCLGCLKVRRVDPAAAMLEGTGINTVDAKDDFVKPSPSERSRINGE